MVDVIYHFLHLGVMGFSTFGWLVPSLRPWHLGLQALVFVSWFVLGAIRGWGYCWLTDVQWTFKQRHGARPATESFVEHWLNGILGLQLSSALIQRTILWTWITTTLASLILTLA